MPNIPKYLPGIAWFTQPLYPLKSQIKGAQSNHGLIHVPYVPFTMRVTYTYTHVYCSIYYSSHYKHACSPY